MREQIQDSNGTSQAVQALATRGRERLDDAAARTVDRIDQASTSVGRSVEKAGDAIDQAGRSAASSVRGAGRYLQSHDPETMRTDFMSLMGRHPGVTLAVGLGAGILIAQAFRPAKRAH